MHYYQFNIGDYASHTSRLSIYEDIAYRRLLDMYYLNERPLNGCSTDVARDIGMSDYLDKVEYVLNKFFIEKNGEWCNKRCDLDIKAYKDKQKSARKAGVASGIARKNKGTDVQRTLNTKGTDVEPTKNYKPLTINQEPLTKDQNLEPKVDKKDVYPDEFEEAWKQYPKRSGANPKRKAFSAFKARLKNKTDQKAIFDGVIRYSKYVLETGKASTEFVMQMATFLGPDEHYLNDWAIPTQKPDEIKPRNDADWQALGRKISVSANPGESMNEYIRRIQIKIKEQSYA